MIGWIVPSVALCAVILLVIWGPFLLAVITFVVEDILFILCGKKRLPSAQLANNCCVSIVIPNWNGRDLLERYLSSVMTATDGNPDNEVLVVDNASTDGSVEFLQRHFPDVRILALEKNYGFGGGSNRGFQAAKNDIVVLLNNDMRVEPDFLEPLLEPFSDPLVFSTSCQIFFSDPLRRREETGLTESWWEAGKLRVSHRNDEEVQMPFPCAYPGGGSSAFHRQKFLELGGFDELLRPFYYEDTDIGHMAWKRGWKLLYQPASVVFHEHRGTIGKRFSPAFIEGVLKKNVILFCWKNVHDWRMLGVHFAASFFAVPACWRAVRQLKQAIVARWRARSLAAVSDREAFLRQKGGYFRDRFQIEKEPVPTRLQVLFAAPYPIHPPVHGGAVFMSQTLESLKRLADVHLIGFVDTATEQKSQSPLGGICASTLFLLRHRRPPRHPSTAVPHAVREFWDRDFEWACHRIIYTKKVDAVQLDYTIMGQYHSAFEHIPNFLFEHDIFFQSLWRGMQSSGVKPVGLLEYARMLRYELRMVKRFTRVQVCSRENREYILQFAPEMKGKIDDDLRAAIDIVRYPFVTEGREPDTMLFVGSFRHIPNVKAIEWFTAEILPQVVRMRPQATLVVVGAEMKQSMKHLSTHPNIKIAGFVDDVRAPLARYKVFLCPVRAGSGVRVKLLEAFACGIPVVSTTMGAEGLATRQTGICELADTSVEFARSVVRLLEDKAYAETLARKAREMVEREKDSRTVTERLEATYRTEVGRLRNPASPSTSELK